MTILIFSNSNLSVASSLWTGITKLRSFGIGLFDLIWVVDEIFLILTAEGAEDAEREKSRNFDD